MKLRFDWPWAGEIGGPDQNRTDDLLIANETLSQLSYGPTRREVQTQALSPARNGAEYGCPDRGLSSSV